MHGSSHKSLFKTNACPPVQPGKLQRQILLKNGCFIRHKVTPKTTTSVSRVICLTKYTYKKLLGQGL